MLYENPLDQIMAMEGIARSAQFQKAWDAYYGRFPKSLVTKRQQADDNVVVNFARIIVDKGVSFLFGKPVLFELQEGEQTPAEDWLSACWSANKKETLLQKMALNGAICGHVFVKLVEHQPYPRIVLLDPATVSVRWKPDDIDVVTGFMVQYPAIDDQQPLYTNRTMTVRQLVELQDNGTWHITDQVSRQGRGGWETTSEQNWPYTWPPILGCQNLPAPNEFWGMGDLEEDVLQLNVSINFLLSNLLRIIRFHAHPKTWGKGFAAKQLDVAADETIVFPAGTAELHNLEMQSDLSSSIVLYRQLREALHELTRIPEVATGRVEQLGALSGTALEILYQPLLEKTETKRRTYGDLLVQLSDCLLEMGNVSVPAGTQTHLHWPALLPEDQLQARQTALLDQQLGVSRYTLLQQLGYDPDIEREKRGAQEAETMARLIDEIEHGSPVGDEDGLLRGRGE